MNEGDAGLASLLIPLQDQRLLVPRSCVAEVIGHQQPRPVAGAPPWYLGVVEWGKASVPIISFECLCGRALPPLTTRSRVVVMHKLGARLDGSGYALLAQGFPQLLNISGEMLQADVAYARVERQPILCRVRLMKELPLIPDLEQLETMIADETRAPVARNRAGL
jgi:chemosensory pili system protein ChpC